MKRESGRRKTNNNEARQKREAGWVVTAASVFSLTIAPAARICSITSCAAGGTTHSLQRRETTAMMACVDTAVSRLIFTAIGGRRHARSLREPARRPTDNATAAAAAASPAGPARAEATGAVLVTRNRRDEGRDLSAASAAQLTSHGVREVLTLHAYGRRACSVL